jgi:hypothetical protein
MSAWLELTAINESPVLVAVDQIRYIAVYGEGSILWFGFQDFVKVKASIAELRAMLEPKS